MQSPQIHLPEIVAQALRAAGPELTAELMPAFVAYITEHRLPEHLSSDADAIFTLARPIIDEEADFTTPHTPINSTELTQILLSYCKK